MLRTLVQSFLMDEVDLSVTHEHVTDEAWRGNEQALADPYRSMQSQLGHLC